MSHERIDNFCDLLRRRLKDKNVDSTVDDITFIYKCGQIAQNCAAHIIGEINDVNKVFGDSNT